MQPALEPLAPIVQPAPAPLEIEQPLVGLDDEPAPHGLAQLDLMDWFHTGPIVDAPVLVHEGIVFPRAVQGSSARPPPPAGAAPCKPMDNKRKEDSDNDSDDESLPPLHSIGSTGPAISTSATTATTTSPTGAATTSFMDALRMSGADTLDTSTPAGRAALAWWIKRYHAGLAAKIAADTPVGNSGVIDTLTSNSVNAPVITKIAAPVSYSYSSKIIEMTIDTSDTPSSYVSELNKSVTNSSDTPEGYPSTFDYDTIAIYDWAEPSTAGVIIELDALAAPAANDSPALIVPVIDSPALIAPVVTVDTHAFPAPPTTAAPARRFGITGTTAPIVEETPAPTKHPSIPYSVALSALSIYVDNLALGTKWSDDNVRPTPEMVNEWLTVCETHWRSALMPTLLQLHKSGMRIELNMGVWFTPTTDNMGYIFNGMSQTINIERLQAIRDLKAPALKNLESIYKLRGVLVSFSRAVGTPAYSQSCAMFTELIVNYQRTGRHIKDAWGPQHDEALEICKREIINAPPVYVNDPALPTHLWTDASTTGWAAVIVQYGRDGYPRINAAFAHSFKDAKLKYGTRHKECFAIVASLRKLRQLKMIWRGLICHTDHANLTYLESTDDPLLLTWLHELACSGILVQHKPGAYNEAADGLSRVGATPDATDTSSTPRLRRVSPEMAEQFEKCRIEALAPEQRHLHLALPTLATLLAHCTSDATLAAPRSTATDTPSPISIAAVTPSPPVHPVKHFMDMQVTFTEEEINSMSNDSAFKRVGVTDAMGGHLGALWMHGQRTVIPASQQLFIDDLLHKAHDQAAHPGAEMTLAYLGPVYWPSMKADVLAYTASCPSCQVIKTPISRGPRGGLRVNNVREPFSVMMVDHMMMTPVSDSGKVGIVHMMCPLTRFSELVAVDNLTASLTLDTVITGWIARHGFPSMIRCDGSKSFEGEFEEFCRDNRIELSIDAPYNPEQRGRLERAHKEFGRIIKSATMQGTQGLWDLAVPQAQMMFNAAVNSSINLSPYEAAYARPFRTASINFTPTIEAHFSTREAFIAHAEHIENIVRLSDELSSHVRAHAYAASHAPAPSFSVDEMILLHTDVINSKLGSPSHWLPGYAVTKIGPEPHMYTVAKLGADGGPGAPVRVNVSRMRKYNASRTPLHGSTVLLNPGESIFTQIVGHTLLNKSKPGEHLEIEVLWANGTRSTAPIADIKASAPAKLEDYISANGIPMASVTRQIKRDTERTSPTDGARGTPSQ